jgi:integrase
MMSDLQSIPNENGETYFFILQVTDIETQSLKNSNSERIIPISSHLIELGFLNYLQERINNKSKTLFNLNIGGDKKRKAFQQNFNTSFNKFYKNNYLEKSDTGTIPTLHSLRSHFVSKFLKDEKEEQRYSLVNLKKLVGHHTKDLHKDVTINSYFRENLEVNFAKKLIDDMDFHIDEGYQKIQSQIKTKYPNTLYTLNL